MVWAGIRETSGRLGQALHFDGTTNAYIQITDPGTGSVFDFPAGSSITLALWVKPERFVSDETFFSKNQDNWGMQLAGGGGGFRFYYYNAVSSWHSYDTTSATMVLGQWSHLAFTYTFGTGSSAQLYLNGQAVSGAWAPDGDASPVTNDGAVFIGRSTANENPLGSIDDVRIYNRALSADEVKRLYNMGH